MPQFHHILFPVDFSESCCKFRPFVKSVADRFHADVTLMHVVQTPVGWYGGTEAAFPILFDVEDMKKAVDSELKTFADRGDFSAQTRVVNVSDQPATAIAKYAQQAGVDLIMMPTHGYGPFRALLLGSVTAKVLHDVECPVWTAAHTEEDSTKHLECREILCAIDLTPEAVPLIRHSLDLARQFAAKLRLVHAVPGGDGATVNHVESEFRRFLFECARDEIRKWQHEAGTDVQVCMEAGSVSKVVRAAAVHHEADLVLIGRGRLHETLGRLRTNAYAIIRDSPCPVLSV